MTEVQVSFRDRRSGIRIENDDIGVETALQCSLLSDQASESCRLSGQPFCYVGQAVVLAQAAFAQASPDDRER